MPYYGINGQITDRVDEGNNVFQGKKCVNSIATPEAPSVDSMGKFVKSTLSYVSDTNIQVTGHVPNFEYGGGKDVEPIKVETGHVAW